MTARSRLAFAVVAVLGAISIGLAPADAQLVLSRLAILALGIVAAGWLLRGATTVMQSTPERFESEIRQHTGVSADIPRLRSVDQTLRMAIGSSFGVEFMLKPLVRDVARWRLLRNRGIDMNATPESARKTVGEPLWALIEPGEPRPKYGAPGLPLAEIQARVDELERV